MPSGCHRAGEFLAIVEREREIARGVALSAMREGFGEIGASVPLGALRRVGLEANVFIEEERPWAHKPTLIEWESQSICSIGRTHRGKAEQVSLDRKSVGIGHVGIGRIRHRRVETSAVAAKPALDG